MKQTTIDTNLLPNVYLRWTTKSGENWLNCQTGEKTTKMPKVQFGTHWANNNYNIYITGGSKPVYAYLKYHEDMEMLELAAVTMNTRKQPVVHPWEYAGEKYFIDKAKRIYDANGNLKECQYYLYQYHGTYEFKDTLGYFGRLKTHPKTMSEFHKFLGSTYFTKGNGKEYEAKWTWHIKEWYVSVQRTTKPKGKQQLLVDKLTAMPHSDASWLDAKYPVRTTHEYRWPSVTTGIIYFEPMTDGWSVLRIFNRNNDGSNFKEIERMYINDKGISRIATPSKDGWVPYKANRLWNLRFTFVNADEAAAKCNRMKYIMPMLPIKADTQIKYALFNALRFSELEQLSKLGYSDVSSKYIASETVRADLKDLFGGYYNDKGKTLLQKIGMTKVQLDIFMEQYNQGDMYRSYRPAVSVGLKKTREFFGDDFIHLDKETFANYLAAFTEIATSAYRGFDGLNTAIGVDERRFLRNLIRLSTKNKGVYTVAKDTINMYQCLARDRRPEVNWYFDSESDLNRAHDAIMELDRIQREERQALWNMEKAERMKKEEEKRKKLDEKRKEFEYEDDNFIIRLPKDSLEIISEGSKQRICIGGYASDHALGHTNLFFLRRKSEPDVPFYAIEVHGNNVNQIHGFGNKWLGNNPEAIPTVVRWLRQNGFKCTKEILTCMANGYGRREQYCEMPVVD